MHCTPKVVFISNFWGAIQYINIGGGFYFFITKVDIDFAFIFILVTF